MIYLNDEEAFYVILSLFENYSCSNMYTDVSSIRKQLYVHDQLVKKYIPDVYQHLKKLSVESIMFATGWYMTLFSSVLPFRYFLRLMDIFFFEKWKIIYRVALSFLKLKRKKLLSIKNFQDIFAVLKDFSEFENNIINEDKFFKSACNDFHFSKQLIAEYEDEYALQESKIKQKKFLLSQNIQQQQKKSQVIPKNPNLIEMTKIKKEVKTLDNSELQLINSDIKHHEDQFYESRKNYFETNIPKHEKEIQEEDEEEEDDDDQEDNKEEEDDDQDEDKAEEDSNNSQKNDADDQDDSGNDKNSEEEDDDIDENDGCESESDNEEEQEEEEDDDYQDNIVENIQEINCRVRNTN